MDVRALVKKLAGVFPPPRDGVNTDAWVETLDDVDYEEVMAAARVYLKSDARYFPTPGKLRTMALESRPPREEDHREGGDRFHNPDASCRICGAPLEPIPEQANRFGHRHFPPAHRAAGVPMTGSFTTPHPWR